MLCPPCSQNKNNLLVREESCKSKDGENGQPREARIKNILQIVLKDGI